MTCGRLWHSVAVFCAAWAGGWRGSLCRAAGRYIDLPWCSRYFRAARWPPAATYVASCAGDLTYWPVLVHEVLQGGDVTSGGSQHQRSPALAVLDWQRTADHLPQVLQHRPMGIRTYTLHLMHWQPKIVRHAWSEAAGTVHVCMCWLLVASKRRAAALTVLRFEVCHCDVCCWAVTARVVLDSWVVSQIWLDSDSNESSQSRVGREIPGYESS